MMNGRSFGVEIEIGNRDLCQMAEILRGAGFNVYCADDDSLNNGSVIFDNNEEYPRDRPEYKKAWRVISDGSVRGGCEVVSPILSGVQGLGQVKNVLKAMNKAGAKADARCGLHVHVGVGDLSAIELQHVARRYAAFESTIDTFINPARRGNNGQYCRSMDKVVRDLDKAIYVSSADLVCQVGDRDHKLNLQAYLKHGTVEFRQLEGTTSWTKIVNWIEFCVSFVEASRLDETEVAAYNAALDRVWNGYPEAIRSLSGRPYVNASILGRLWNLEQRNHILNQIKAINAAYPGAFEERWDYWNVNISFPTAKAPAVTGAWSKGIPTHVVSHLLNIAKKHNETAVSV